MKKDDKTLIVDFLAGDQSSFTHLVENNLPIIYRYAFRLTRDEGDAQDITQETFVKVWRNISKFDLNKNFRTWILAIAHNTALDLLRKKKDLVFSEFDTNEGGNTIADTLADPSPLPPEIFAHAENKKLLDHAMSKLPLNVREVLVLHYHEGLTFAEIGDILEKPLNTVKSQHKRALDSLREILEKSMQYIGAPKYHIGAYIEYGERL